MQNWRCIFALDDVRTSFGHRYYLSAGTHHTLPPGQRLMSHVSCGTLVLYSVVFHEKYRAHQFIIRYSTLVFWERVIALHGKSFLKYILFHNECLYSLYDLFHFV